jgi:hypothetical protein
MSEQVMDEAGRMKYEREKRTEINISRYIHYRERGSKRWTTSTIGSFRPTQYFPE